MCSDAMHGRRLPATLHRNTGMFADNRHDSLEDRLPERFSNILLPQSRPIVPPLSKIRPLLSISLYHLYLTARQSRRHSNGSFEQVRSSQPDRCLKPQASLQILLVDKSASNRLSTSHACALHYRTMEFECTKTSIYQRRTDFHWLGCARRRPV